MELILLLTALMTGNTSAYFQEITTNHPPMTMFLKTANIKITQVTLFPREEKNPPVGQPPTPNRDIGFATVIIRLENHQETDAKIQIRNISIVDTNNQTQKFDFPGKDITLRPLENSELAFHLTNKTGYLQESNTVKAVVTHQMGNQLNTTTSELVEVNRH